MITRSMENGVGQAKTRKDMHSGSLVGGWGGGREKYGSIFNRWDVRVEKRRQTDARLWGPKVRRHCFRVWT